jgi:hypothetical protein
LDDFAASGEHVDGVAIASSAARVAHLMLDGGLAVDAVAALDSIRHSNLYPDDVATLLELRDSIRASMESMAT